MTYVALWVTEEHDVGNARSVVRTVRPEGRWENARGYDEGS